MRQFIAVILFTLFNLGAFGVTIKQHLCCHAQQTENTSKHCNENESCCDDKEGCCDEIVSQIKIAKDYNSNSDQINFEFSVALQAESFSVYTKAVASIVKNENNYSSLAYFPPPENYQVVYSSFLI